MSGPHRERLFTEAHRLYHDRLYLYLRRRTESPETAEDLCAETFRIGWQKLATASELPVSTLFGIAKNLLRNHYRSQRRFVQLVERVTHTFDRTPHPAETVHAALERLKAADREILMLTYWDDFTVTESARLLGCTPGAARVRLHRARNALTKHLPSVGETP